MFKAFKYLLLASLYKKAKKSFVMLFVYLVALMLVSFIINDLMSISTGVAVYILILIKWVSILALLSLIGFSILKIFNIATNPFKSKEDEINESCKAQDVKKDRILAKERLFTQSDLIMQKYMKD
ncbi:MAG: hypothetical protein K8R44_01755 [Sulfurimonas sp.]|nr:hypothetical protein [Sulfurimonas sp.]